MIKRDIEFDKENYDVFLNKPKKAKKPEYNRSEARAPKVKFDVAFYERFKPLIVEIYNNYNLALPNEIFYADSTAEQDLGVPGVRSYGGSSDFDILFPFPNQLSENEVSVLEEEIRDALAEIGIDFNFAELSKLRRGNAYDRACRKVQNFMW